MILLYSILTRHCHDGENRLLSSYGGLFFGRTRSRLLLLWGLLFLIEISVFPSRADRLMNMFNSMLGSLPRRVEQRCLVDKLIGSWFQGLISF